MPTGQVGQGADQISDLPTLNYLWDEYKYRHELCWAAIYKFTAAVVILGAVPYVHVQLAASLGPTMLVPPAVGSLLALLGFFVVNNELKLFAHAKLAHHELRRLKLSRFMRASEMERVSEDLTSENARWTLFDKYANGLMLALFVLSVFNAVFLISHEFKGIPCDHPVLPGI